MSPQFDVIVIGSGPAGTHASYPLVQAGLRVAMIDGGNQSVEQPPSAETFEEARLAHADQHRLFLGEDFSGIPLDAMGVGTRGSIVSGRRSYVVADTDALLPIRLNGIRLFQTLARGGLGAVWGGVCAYYAAAELEAMGLPAAEMERHYDVVTERIGVSGPQTRPGIQPPFRVDHHAQLLLGAYERKRSAFDELELGLSQPHSAVLTRELAGRRSAAYRDLEYWSDTDRTVYRPQFTLEELERHENFSYFGGRLVQRVQQRADDCCVHSVAAFEAGRGGPPSLTGRRVIVAAGAVGSARILLRSLGLYERPIPFLGKPHWLTACLHPRTLGRAGAKARLSLCQLLLSDTKRQRPEDHLSAGYAQLYSYKSLGLIRMLGFVPASGPEALGLLALLVPSLVIADIRFPVVRRASRFMKLCRDADGSDWVQLEASSEPEEFRASRDSLQRLTSGLRELGLLPLKRKELPYGASAHYGGTIPCAPASAAEVLSVDESGKLHQATHIYVADSSTFRFLPAKSINMTIMANANRVGERVRDSLSS